MNSTVKLLCDEPNLSDDMKRSSLLRLRLYKGRLNEATEAEMTSLIYYVWELRVSIYSRLLTKAVTG